jgi:Fic family protein
MIGTAPREWINDDRVEFFEISDFIDKIKLNNKVLSHVEYTSDEFEKYLEQLAYFSEYDNYKMMYYWLDAATSELRQSIEVESNSFGNKELLEHDLFFDKMSISKERIRNIHKFVCASSKVNTDNPGEFRKKDIDVGADYPEGHQVFWYPPEKEDVIKFVDSYLKFYKTNSIRELYSNPFIKSSLAHLMLVRIQPFDDGNRRTARIIQNLAFTSGINKVYGTNLKLSPLNISTNINMYRTQYMDRIHRIKFDINSDNSDAVNAFLDFILNMYDEQLYFQMENMPKLLKEISRKQPYGDLDNIVSKSNIKKLPNIKR